MASQTTAPAGEQVPTADQRLVTYGVPWSHYETQLALRGDHPVPRIAFLEGALELMSPSKDRERIKSYIGRLVEAYALEREIDLSPYGSWTLKQAPQQAGLEPDECYLVGDQQRDTPDLAIEVVWTSGGIEKLEIYRRLGVGEVWIRGSRFMSYRGNVTRRRSGVLFPRPRRAVARLVPRPPYGTSSRESLPRSAPPVDTSNT